MKENNVTVVFPETTVPTTQIDSLQEAASEIGHKIVVAKPLFTGSLGDKNSGADTYINMLKFNTNTIVDEIKQGISNRETNTSPFPYFSFIIGIVALVFIKKYNQK